MKIHQLKGSDSQGYFQMHVIDPDSTDVAAVAKVARKAIEVHAAFVPTKRAHTAAQASVETAERNARAEARRAGADDVPVKPKEIRKRVAARREEAELAELEFEAASAKMRRKFAAYADAVTLHAPALRAEAMRILDGSILSIASVVTQGRRAVATMSGAVQVLGGLETPEDFRPRALTASKPEFGEAGAPSVHADVGFGELAKAVAYAMQILDDVKKSEKQARLEDEADEAPDLPEDDDEDLDDE